MREPTNINGVVAYPNENGNREIRFIDSCYRKLFTVPNGGNIIITDFHGQQKTSNCKYIDDYHAVIGNNVFHICEFAKLMEQNGIVYAPEQKKEGDITDIYEIYQLKDVSSVEYSFCDFSKAKGNIKPEHYMRVYAGMLAPGVTLEDLFMKHNRDDRPFSKKMRSLSMSDIIVITKNEEKTAYYIGSMYVVLKEFLK